MTSAQQQACAWLAERNGSGVWCRDGRLLAAGDYAPITRGTWNALRAAGCVWWFDKTSRVELTYRGAQVAAERPFTELHHDMFDDEEDAA